MERSELRERRRLCRSLGLFLREARGVSTARLRSLVLEVLR